MTTDSRKTEIIAIGSGKGGTGKTLITACLGYALQQSGHRTLMIDTDRGTNGLSLFLLGNEGRRQINDYASENTFNGILTNYATANGLAGGLVQPRKIHRKRDHQINYTALISSRSLYGHPEYVEQHGYPPLSREDFGKAVNLLFEQIRSMTPAYDYVLLDTRGGFSYESSDICALADSFILVTEADYTSFYQDRSLVQQIGMAAGQVKASKSAFLRGIIVNKATEGLTYHPETDEIDLEPLEREFRMELQREFPVTINETYPIPLDVEILLAYKTQQIPYLKSPSSLFCYASLEAFSKILQTVTVQWEDERHDRWDEFIDQIDRAIKESNKTVTAQLEEEKKKDQKLAELQDQVAEARKTIETLNQQIELLKASHERELESSKEKTVLFETSLQREAQKLQQEIESQKVYKRSSRRTFAIVTVALSLIFLLTGIYLFKTQSSNVDTVLVLEREKLKLEKTISELELQNRELSKEIDAQRQLIEEMQKKIKTK